MVLQKAYQDAEFPEDEEAVGDFMLSRLNNEIKPGPRRISYTKWLAAASILVIIGVSWLFV